MRRPTRWTVDMGQLVPEARTGAKIRTIMAQLEAASTLLKFAADDMIDLAECENAPLSDALSHIAQGLRKSATALLENALYLDRIEATDESDDGPAEATHAFRPNMRRA